MKTLRSVTRAFEVSTAVLGLRLALILTALLSIRPAVGAPGDLDPTFGNSGSVVLDIAPSWVPNPDPDVDESPPSTLGKCVAVQADGKILIGGSTEWFDPGWTKFALARVSRNGTLDTRFGAGGFVVSDFKSYAGAEAMAIQPDGKIITAGRGVVYFPAAGQTQPSSIIVQRYNANGSLDRSFGGDGKVEVTLAAAFDGDAVEFGGLALQGDGKIVIAGGLAKFVFDGEFSDWEQSFLILRFNPNGTLDGSFGDGGKVVKTFGWGGYGYALALQADGKLLVGGQARIGGGSQSSPSYGVLGRFLVDGTLDPSFGAAGYVKLQSGGASSSVFGTITKIEVIDSGKIVVVGTVGKAYTLARLSDTGTLDTGFGNAGMVNAGSSDYGVLGFRVYGVLGFRVDKTGRILTGESHYDSVRWSYYPTLLRFSSGGAPDSEFGTAGKVAPDFPMASGALGLQENGGIILGGTMWDFATGKQMFALLRFKGEPDTVGIGITGPDDATLLDGVSTIDLGGVNPDQSTEALPFTIFSTGTASLTGVAVTIDGANASDFTATPVADTVLPEESATFTVTFAPSGFGARTATLHVASNDPLTPSFDIVLTGTGRVGPVAYDDGAVLTGASVEVPVLANDTDGMALPLSVSAVTDGSFGTVITDGTTATYTPGAEFDGTDSFTYTASNGTDTDSASVHITSTLVFVRVGAVAVKGGASRGAGDVPGEAPGTTFKSYGLPSVDAGNLGARATIQNPAGTATLAIVGGDTGGVLVRAGDPAPGVTDAVFAKFSEPVFGAGTFGFAGVIKGTARGAVSTASDTGLWCGAGGPLALVAREGDPAPGANGARFAAFPSYVFPARGSGLIFLASLKGTGVRRGVNDRGLWQQQQSGGLELLLRTGDIAEGRTIKTLDIFAPATGLPGQRRGYSGSGFVAAKVTFNDGTAGIVVIDGGQAELRLFVNDPVAEIAGAKWKAFGSPAVNDDGKFAMRAMLKPGSGGIEGKTAGLIAWGRDYTDMMIVARAGDAAPQLAGATFASLGEPALNNAGALAFLAELSGDYPAADKTALFWGAPGALEIAARTGTQASGLPTGVSWRTIKSFVLPEMNGGPAFVATLSGGGVTAANRTGLWAIASDHSIRLLARTGETILFGGKTKTISTITTFGAAVTSSGQGRFADEMRHIAARVTFSDHTSALLRFTVP